MIRVVVLILLSVGLSSCKMSPYGSKFDCPIPDGLRCKSLYEVNKLADSGMFDPANSDVINTPAGECSKKCFGYSCFKKRKYKC